MEELPEENRQREEKRAFYVGLATVLVVLLVAVLLIIFLPKMGNSNGAQEGIKQNAPPQESTAPDATPAEQGGNVAGQSTEAKPTEAAQGQKYTVQSGDTLFEIGKKFNIDWHIIAEANSIENSAALRAGKEIIIPSE